MQHYVAGSVEETLLCWSWEEVGALWSRVVAACPGAAAICVMPDHVHILHGRDVRVPLLGAMRGYARWRHARRGHGGPVFRALAPPVVAAGPVKQRRDERYIHLNPCRAELVGDPLAWPFSTHRDAVGLAVGAVRGTVSDPHGYHAYISGDPHVAVAGTELPSVVQGPRELAAVRDAVSAVTRTPLERLQRRGQARSLLIRAARVLTEASAAEIALLAGVSVRTVLRASRAYETEVAVVDRVVGDDRFPALASDDLRQQRAWRRYMARRGIRR